MNLKEIKKNIDKKLSNLAPFRVISFGFFTYVLLGLLAISLPFAQKVHVGVVDNLFNVVSAMSTTGLTTGSISEMYTFWGNLILLCLIQLGAIGYMTLTSFFILSGGNKLSKTRIKILSAEFLLPEGFEIWHFVKHIIIYTATLEIFGTLLLWFEFNRLGVSQSLWNAAFHAISAFATAGFSLFHNNLESFSGNYLVNFTIGFLCYSGAIGFIVPLDIYRRLTKQTNEITFTSKVILGITAIVFVGGTLLYFLCEHGMPEAHGLLIAAFQIMSASTTTGYNSYPIGSLSTATLALIMFVMIIGASPSGTGGGVKTTTISAMLGVISSVMRGHSDRITFLGRAIPLNRVFNAVAVTATYIFVMFVSIFLVCIVDNHSFLQLSFETASALGTVGLSTGITADLTNLAKIILTATMFLGRVGPLTLGLAFFHTNVQNRRIMPTTDLAA